MDALEGHLLAKLSCAQAKKDRLTYMRIDGSTPALRRSENVKMFQEVEGCRIALLSITAACLGLTLTSATAVIFAEAHWTPALMLQAEDRAHRIG